MRTLSCAAAMGLALISASAIPAAPLTRADGTIIHYTLDRPEGAVEGLILIAQGSGCLPTAKNPSLATVRAAFPNYAALMMEKSGVMPDAGIIEGFTDCPPEFHAGYTISQRVADYRALIAHVRQEAPDLLGRLVLFGGSEGGLAVARLAATEGPQASIILSSATGMSLREMVLETVPPEGKASVSAGFDAASLDPEGTTLFAGSSHRFWADILGQISLDYMLEAEGPFLQIQGGRDASSPPSASRRALEAFAERGSCALTYWEFPGLDHGLAAPDGTAYLPDIIAMAALWVENAPEPCE